LKEDDKTIQDMAEMMALRLAAGETASEIRLNLEALRGEPFTGPEWRALIVAARLLEGFNEHENRP